MQNANKIIEKLKNVFNLSTDIELAGLLKISPTTLSTWKSRNSMDYKLIIDLCEAHDIDLNYLFLGRNKSEESLKTLEPLIGMVTNRVKEEIREELLALKTSQQTLFDLFEKEEVKRQIEQAKKKVQNKQYK